MTADQGFHFTPQVPYPVSTHHEALRALSHATLGSPALEAARRHRETCQVCRSTLSAWRDQLLTEAVEPDLTPDLTVGGARPVWEPGPVPRVVWTGRWPDLAGQVALIEWSVDEADLDPPFDTSGAALVRVGAYGTAALPIADRASRDLALRIPLLLRRGWLAIAAPCALTTLDPADRRLRRLVERAIATAAPEVRPAVDDWLAGGAPSPGAAGQAGWAAIRSRLAGFLRPPDRVVALAATDEEPADLCDVYARDDAGQEIRTEARVQVVQAAIDRTGYLRIDLRWIGDLEAARGKRLLFSLSPVVRASALVERTISLEVTLQAEAIPDELRAGPPGLQPLPPAAICDLFRFLLEDAR